MRRKVYALLKETNNQHIFSNDRFDSVCKVMKHAESKDLTLKQYLSISPDFRVQFIADHMIKLVEQQLI